MEHEIVWLPIKEAHDVVEGFIRHELTFYYELVLKHIKNHTDQMMCTFNALKKESEKPTGFANKKTKKQKQYETLLQKQKNEFHRYLQNEVRYIVTCIANDEFANKAFDKHAEINCIASTKKAGLPKYVIELAAPYKGKPPLIRSLLPLDAAKNLPYN